MTPINLVEAVMAIVLLIPAAGLLGGGIAWAVGAHVWTTAFLTAAVPPAGLLLAVAADVRRALRRRKAPHRLADLARHVALPPSPASCGTQRPASRQPRDGSPPPTSASASNPRLRHRRPAPRLDRISRLRARRRVPLRPSPASQDRTSRLESPAVPPHFHRTPSPDPPMADLRTLDALRADPPDSIGALVDRLGQAAFGVGILFVGAINLFAPIPGLGQAAAVLAVLLVLQIAQGARHPWLPPRIRNVALPPDKVAQTLAAAIPWIARATRLARPGTLPAGRVAIPLLAALPLLFMLIPLPGSNMLVAPALMVLGVAQSMDCIRLAALGLLLQAGGLGILVLAYGSLLAGVLAVAGA